jgi:hypothetical protein
MLFQILAALIGFTLFYGQQSGVPQKFEQDLPQLLVPQSTGKERQIVSMTKDASMYTERKRREAIQTVHGCNLTNKLTHTCTSECGTQIEGCTLAYRKPIKETKNTPGFTNGAVEAYMLSSICNKRGAKVVVPPGNVTQIYYGGTPFDDFQNILDGGSPGMDNPAFDIYYDGGGPMSNYVTVFDGLDPLSNIMDIVYSRLKDIPNLDGGTPNTNL